MESTKIWKDVEGLVGKNFISFISDLSNFYPKTEESFYRDFFEKLFGLSIVYTIQKEMTKENFMDTAGFVLAENKEVLDAIKPNLKNLASELEKYKSSLSAKKLTEFEYARKKREYIF